MKARNVLNRIHVQRLLLAAAISCFPLIGHAAKAGDFGKASISQTGKSTTIYPMGSVNSGGSTIPVSPSIGGWSAAGNYGFPTTATGPTAGVNYRGQFADGGSPVGQAMKYPFEAKSTVPWGDVAKGIGTMGCSLVTGGAAALACAVAVPFVMDWITKSGGRLDPVTGELQRKDPEVCTVAPCFDWWVNSAPHAGSQSGACSAYATWLTSRWGYEVQGFRHVGNKCVGELKQTPTSGWEAVSQDYQYNSRPPSTGAGWLPSSMDDIAPYMDAPSSGSVIGEILSQGGTIPLGTPTVTGPASIKGPETTTQNPDGSRTVTSTTNNYTTSGNTVTNTSSVTNTTTYNTDNSVRSTSSSTTTPAEETEKTDLCKEFPNRLGCIETDTPEQEIPKQNKNVTWAAEDSFGGGSCPVDQTVNLGTIGQSVKVTNWTQVCEWSIPLRFIVLALASFAAFLIVMPGETRT